VCCAQLYRACGYTFLCYPLLLEVSDFYLSQDMEFVIDEVRVDSQFYFLFFYHWLSFPHCLELTQVGPASSPERTFDDNSLSLFDTKSALDNEITKKD